MSRRLTFHNAAERELTDAAAYYDNSSPGLGASFIDDVELAITQIEQYPESGYLLNRVVRRVLLRRFPYAVMYSVSPDEIRILAIANLKRRPFYWQGRR
ncbi:MAG TPA: type II toxin-antitoxin system RelE/ParE family toxin [Terriglobia bacterium]